MIICHSRRFVFVHIQKCGGESIATALTPCIKLSDIICGNSIRGRLTTKYMRPKHNLFKHSFATDIRLYLGEDKWDQYFTFCFVRHPVERAYSIYTYIGKLLAQRWRVLMRIPAHFNPGNFWNWRETENFLRSRSFSEFIRDPLFDEMPTAKPMVGRVTENGSMIVDYVGKLETITEDMGQIAQRIGIEHVVLPHANSSGIGTKCRIKKDDEAFLRTKYAEDLEFFKYS